MLSDNGIWPLPYLGGFGYLFSVIGVGVILNREIYRSQRGRLLAYEMLYAEQLHYHKTYEQLISHDGLTALPNRAALLTYLGQVTGGKVQRRALVLVDLDRFDLINSSLGHSSGDLLLRQVADRLRSQLREGDFLARSGDNEFAIVSAPLDSPDSIDLRFGHLPTSLTDPFTISNYPVTVSASIGAAIYPDDGKNDTTLLQAADLALREAKKKPQKQLELFGQQLNAEFLDHLRLGRDLRQALNQSQFRLYFQPQVTAVDHQIIGVEALLRWQHGTDGLIPPDRFIPIAEELHLIVPIGNWVIDEACRHLAAWKAQGLTGLRMAINISVQQLQYGDLTTLTLGVLQRYGLTAQDIELEITESAMMSDPEQAIKQLEQLRRAGIRLAVDDFGTGYSSLGYLKTMPINALKIDRSFTDQIIDDSHDAAICRGAITIASQLGLETVAEGIETAEQAALLRDMGCLILQGYYFSRPLSGEELLEKLRLGGRLKTTDIV